MIKKLLIKRLFYVIFTLFLVFILSFSGYSYFKGKTQIEVLERTIEVIQGDISIEDFSNLENSSNELYKLYMFQIVMFLLTSLSFLGLIYHLFKLYLVQRKGALEDQLTEINNRRAILIALNMEIERVKRYNHPLSVAMIDIDYFKKFNDLNGHVAGDRVLKKVARILKNNIRHTDYVGRIGGEEFLVVFPETKPDVAAKVCENLRKIVEKNIFAGQENMPNKRVTISVGVAGLKDKKVKDRWLLIADADKKLYIAKNKGRNQVIF